MRTQIFGLERNPQFRYRNGALIIDVILTNASF